jgi:hypothetical protein
VLFWNQLAAEFRFLRQALLPCPIHSHLQVKSGVGEQSVIESGSIVMRPPFRSKQEVVIHAPLEAVWAFSMDLTKIPEFHPRVVKVDLVAGQSFREPGVSYKCHLSGGKHTCIEKDIEIVPLEKIVTVLPQDTFGISKILSDYRAETTFQKLDDFSTRNQPLLLDNEPESQTPQPNSNGPNRPRDSSNFKCGQSRNRSCKAGSKHHIVTDARGVTLGCARICWNYLTSTGRVF